MKKTLTLLVATTALTAAIGVPAWSAMQSPSDVLRPVAALFDDAPQAMPLVLASDDDDDDCRSGARNPAPAGTVAPPQNGLFGNGAPPKVQVN
ncbi:MAG: hypothetical protein FD152_1955 [Xanthobacteraceae bacterium]|nr:MAG: hypothetical protein FD152_1955 [Xanthobacteraceae bacterium]